MTFSRRCFKVCLQKKLKDFSGEKMSDGRLQDLLEKFDPKVKDVLLASGDFSHK